MDKFGIFKLLNSFFNLYGQKNPTKTTESDFASDKSSSVLSELLKSLTNSPAPLNNTQQNSTQNVEKAKSNTTPLQADMLKTITSHDQFLNRVKQKNPQ